MAEFAVIDPEVGKVYEYECNRQLIRLQCVEGDPYFFCKDCYFNKVYCGYRGHCHPTSREDGKNIIFKFLSAKYHLSEASKCYKLTCSNPECGKTFWSEKISRLYCCKACSLKMLSKRRHDKYLKSKSKKQ